MIICLLSTNKQYWVKSHKGTKAAILGVELIKQDKSTTEKKKTRMQPKIEKRPIGRKISYFVTLYLRELDLYPRAIRKFRAAAAIMLLMSVVTLIIWNPWRTRSAAASPSRLKMPRAT